MPKFGGRKAKPKAQPNPFRSPSPEATEEKDPSGQVKFLTSNFPAPPRDGGSREQSPPVDGGAEM
eukprot:12104696-Karenia_brevis.AAC.1